MTDRRAYLVPPEHIRTFWPQVEPYVKRSIDRARGDFISADVYAALVSKQARLYITTSDDGETTGCFVLTQNDRFGVHQIYVWVAGHKDGDRSIADYQDWLAGVTKESGCTRWCADSPRRFDLIVPGLKIAHYHFVKEI